MTKPIEDILPLTSLQEALLLRVIECPDDDVYLEEAVVRLKRPLNVKRLQSALTALFERHSGLRARFHWEELKRPVQMILPADGTTPFTFIDISSEQNNNFDETIREWFTNSKPCIDISLSPIQICLIQGKKHAAITLLWHHILLDGWSLAICLREIFEDYSEEAARIPETLKTTPKSLLPADDTIRNAGAFWRASLESVEPSFLLTSEVVEGSTKNALTTDRHVEEFDCLAAVAQFCSTVSATPAALYYTAWGLLVQRWTHSRDALFGTVFSGRDATSTQLDQTVGMFINTLPVRVSSDGSSCVHQAVLTTQSNLQNYSQNQSASLADIVQMIRPGMRGHVFDSLFVVENYPLEPDLLGSSSSLIQSVTLDEKTEFPVTATVLEVAGKLRFAVTVHGACPQGLARTFAKLWGHLLQQMIADPQAKLASLQNLAGKDLLQRQSSFQAAIKDGPFRSLLDAVRYQAELLPDQIALIDAARSLTYREMVAEIDQKAKALSVCGTKPGDLVGILTERSIETVLCLMAVHRVGAAYVPISGDYPD